MIKIFQNYKSAIIRGLLWNILEAHMHDNFSYWFQKIIFENAWIFLKFSKIKLFENFLLCGKAMK